MSEPTPDPAPGSGLPGQDVYADGDQDSEGTTTAPADANPATEHSEDPAEG